MLFQNSIANHVRLIVIHPNYLEQHLALPQFILDKASDYIRFGGSQLNVEQAKAHLHHVSPCANLAFLILDECDRIESSALDFIIRDLLYRLNTTRIVLLTRRLPEIVIDDEAVRAITQIVPSGINQHFTDFAMPGVIPQLEVHAFGQGRVFVNGKEITNWGGVLSRVLFFFMIDNPIITRELIFETFWPGQPLENATNVFHVTKGTIHDVLGFELIQFYGGFYRINTSISLVYDVEKFHDMLQDGMQQQDAEMLMAADRMFKHSFLQGTTMPWVIARRAELQLQYSEYMNSLAQLKVRAGEVDSALGLSIRILAYNRSREDVAERIMQLYMDRNQPCDALKIFDQTEEFLQVTLGTKPDTGLQNLGTAAQLRCKEQSAGR